MAHTSTRLIAFAITNASGSSRRTATTAEESRITWAALSRRTTVLHDQWNGKAPSDERRIHVRSLAVAPPTRPSWWRARAPVALGPLYPLPQSCFPRLAALISAPPDEFSRF